MAHENNARNRRRNIRYQNDLTLSHSSLVDPSNYILCFDIFHYSSFKKPSCEWMSQGSLPSRTRPVCRYCWHCLRRRPGGCMCECRGCSLDRPRVSPLCQTWSPFQLRREINYRKTMSNVAEESWRVSR